MKAAICERYGPPENVKIADVPAPSPKPNEVLIRVQATTVSSGDWRIRSLDVPRGFRLITRLAFGWSGPRQRVLGTELVGEVVETGASVTRFKVGDQVIAFAGVGMGCHAELKTMPESGAIVKRPVGLSDEEAASLCFGGTAALYFLRDLGRVERGQSLLVVGASGAVGTAAIQLARHFGAEVDGVASAANRELLESLGVRRAIDYAKETFAEGDEPYDLILDAVGATTFAQAKQALKPTGKFLLVASDLAGLLGALLPSRGGRKALGGVAPERREDVEFLVDLAAKGAFRPVVDSVYPFADIAKAHARVETKRKRGSVVVRVAP